MNRSIEKERWFVERCVEAGLKMTPQRRELYLLLAMTKDHPNAESIYRLIRRKIPYISLDTVYRNLRTLEEHAIIQRVGSAGYRTRFDANMDPHHHFVCTSCGLMSDFCSDELDVYRPPREVTRMGAVNSIYVELRGICRTCSKGNGTNDSSN